MNTRVLQQPSGERRQNDLTGANRRHQQRHDRRRHVDRLLDDGDRRRIDVGRACADDDDAERQQRLLKRRVAGKRHHCQHGAGSQHDEIDDSQPGRRHPAWDGNQGGVDDDACQVVDADESRAGGNRPAEVLVDVGEEQTCQQRLTAAICHEEQRHNRQQDDGGSRPRIKFDGRQRWTASVSDGRTVR